MKICFKCKGFPCGVIPITIEKGMMLCFLIAIHVENKNKKNIR